VSALSLLNVKSFSRLSTVTSLSWRLASQPGLRHRKATGRGRRAIWHHVHSTGAQSHGLSRQRPFPVKPFRTIAVAQKRGNSKPRAATASAWCRTNRISHARQHQGCGRSTRINRRGDQYTRFRHPRAAQGDRRKVRSARNNLDSYWQQRMSARSVSRSCSNAFQATLNRRRRKSSSCAYWVTPIREMVDPAVERPVFVPTTIENRLKLLRAGSGSCDYAEPSGLMFNSPSNPSVLPIRKPELKGADGCAMRQSACPGSFADDMYEHLPMRNSRLHHACPESSPR